GPDRMPSCATAVTARGTTRNAVRLMPTGATPCAAAACIWNFRTLLDRIVSPEKSDSCSHACCEWWRDVRFLHKVQVFVSSRHCLQDVFVNLLAIILQGPPGGSPSFVI